MPDKVAWSWYGTLYWAKTFIITQAGENEVDLRAGGGGGVGIEAIADIAALFLFLMGAGGMGMFARFVGSLIVPDIPLTLNKASCFSTLKSTGRCLVKCERLKIRTSK